MAEHYAQFVGIDVAAATVTVSVWQADGTAGTPFTVAQDAAGYAQLEAHLAQTAVAAAATLVVLEATGSYWLRLATHLVGQGYAVSVLNPAQAHHFARTLLRRDKHDAADACLLAQLAATLQPAVWTPPPAVYEELRQRLVQRDSLVGLRQQVRNQRHALQQQPLVVAAVQQRMEALLATLDEQIQQIEREVHRVLQQDSAWAQAAARLQSIPGVGLLTSGWLLVTTLAFSACETPEAATAYAGLAPRARQSGTSVRGRARIGHSGNRRLRTAPYLATLSATRFNPVIRTLYERLKAAGKPEKVARCAAARKLLHLAWAVVTKEQDFDPDYGQPAPVAASGA
ncbi:MAG: IS110 family transposase [Anaerolineales bacterium]|nr:IS110 family transposase [Anaerolineales bacterium]